MDPFNRVGDVLLGVVSIAVSTALSLMLSRWFARREVAAKNRRDDRVVVVDEFSEHRQAFQARVVQLERRCTELEADSKECHDDLETMRRDNMALLRVNFDLSRQLDLCRELRSSGPHPHQQVG